MDINGLRFFLEWLITPQDAGEQELFRKEGLVDDYIALNSRIPTMGFGELVREINIQLAPYGQSLDLLA